MSIALEDFVNFRFILGDVHDERNAATLRKLKTALQNRRRTGIEAWGSTAILTRGSPAIGESAIP